MLSLLTKRLSKESLVANSFSLILASLVNSAFGFFFWIVIANSFPTAKVGLATTLISASSLLSLLGLAGFDTTFIRFLGRPTSGNSYINVGLLITALMAGILSGIFCLVAASVSPELSFVHHTALNSVVFVTITVFTTWNTLTNAVLIAYRSTHFVLAINGVLSLARLGLPFLFRSGGPMTIFILAGIFQLANVLLSIGVLMKYFGYMPSLQADFQKCRDNLRYGLANYFGSILNLISDFILPLIVLNELGAAAAAYFYVAFTIANLLYTIAFSAAQTTLAAASSDEPNYLVYVRKGFKVMTALLIPAIILVVVACPIILTFFGHNYRAGSTDLLRILALSGAAVMAYSVVGAIAKITSDLRAVLATTGTNAVLIVTLSYVFARHWGLAGIGWAWLIGTCGAACVGAGSLAFRRRGYAH